MFSLIVTVKNEVKNLPAWLASIRAQTLAPTEIVIVDGGSEDGTWKWLEAESENDKKIKIFQEVGNIAHGRNFAIRNSSEQLIVVTDAGCTYHKDWLKSIVQPFEKKEVVWSATGFGPWLEKKDGPVITALAAATTPARDEFQRDWLPSSRSVAFYKDRWQTAGGYPEWIPFCEDVLLDLKLIRKQGKPFFVREALVFWRPRPNIFKYFKQLFNYTRSEGHGKLNTLRQAIRFSVYALSLVVLYLTLVKSPTYIYILAVGLAVYIFKFWKRWSEFTAGRNIFYRLCGVLLVPFVVAFGDAAKMLGYLYGTLERVFKVVGEGN